MSEKNILSGAEAGCSAMEWETMDGKRLFARNFDFTSIAEGSGVMYLPRGTEYASSDTGELRRSAYRAVGMGISVSNGIYAFYDGVNECGLAGAQLYYRNFAKYEQPNNDTREDIQPPLLVYRVLAECSGVDEVIKLLGSSARVINSPLMGSVPPLHWMFCDSSGKNAIIEPDCDGLNIYTDTAGVMTNSPPYPWHRLNLLNYTGIECLDRGDALFGDEKVKQCFSGSGAAGLPGDWSSPSRFIRLASLKKYACKGKDEEQGVAYMFRLMDSVAFPLGMVRVNDKECISEKANLDYTVYTSVMCLQTKRYYWNTYEDRSLHCADMNRLGNGMLVFPLVSKIDVKFADT